MQRMITPTSRRGLTLIEMLIAVAILAVAAALVAPILTNDSRLRVMAASQIVASDIELAQVMTISQPQDPVVVRFDPANDRYWLAYAFDPATPMPRSDNGEPYLITLGQGRARSAQGVGLATTNIAQNTIAFDATGALTDFSQTPYVEFSDGRSAITLAIAPMTGTMTEHNATIDELMKNP